MQVRKETIGTIIWVAKTIAYTFAEIITAITVAFILIHEMPGNPYLLVLYSLLRKDVPLEQAKWIAYETVGYNPNVPIIVSWAEYMWNVFHGNLGRSMILKIPVMNVIAYTAPWTISIVSFTLTLAFATGYLIGIYSAHKGGIVDTLINGSLAFFHSIPSYILATVFLLIFSVDLKLVPLSGWASVAPSLSIGFILNLLHHLILPITTYYLLIFPSWVFGTRSLAVSITNEDYVLVAKARNLPDKRILWSYIGKNALLPQLTALLYSYGIMFGSSTFIEGIFGIPGLGSELGSAAGARDYTLTIGIFLILIIAVILGNLIADLSYGIIDPRVRSS